MGHASPSPNLRGREVGSELCISIRLRFHFLESAELSYLPTCFPKVADFMAVAYFPYPRNINNEQATDDYLHVSMTDTIQRP